MIYPLAADTFGDEEIAAAKAVLDSRRLTMGERVAAFERAFAAFVGAPHAVMVNSGSSANLIMVDAMLRRTHARGPLEPGDKVIVPALAWPTTVWPLVQLGLVPVFVDVDPQTLAIDFNKAHDVVGPRTRAVFLTHVLGRAADTNAAQTFCEAHGLHLLEDACESLGARRVGRHVGTIGAMGSFSLYFSHHLSTIEGGVVVTRSGAVADDLRSLRAHGWTRDRSDREYWKTKYADIDERFLFIMSGYNVRPTEIQAAMGSVQLRRLPAMLDARKTLAAIVAAHAETHTPWLELIGASCAYDHSDEHSWMMLPFRLRADAPFSLKDVKARLQAVGVDTRPIIAGNFVRHPAVQRMAFCAADDLSVADELFDRGFMIGCHPTMSPEATGELLTALRTLA